jgi:formylglycine-generating enzyme
VKAVVALARLASIVTFAGVAFAGPARVGPGVYRPAFPTSANDRAIEVPAFWLDREQVTNAEFREYVRAEPRWRRDRASQLVVDRDYLAHWAGADALGLARPRAPVVRVSWFAARAFCAWRGGRLPREAEWELAAAADERRHDVAGDPAFEARILAWYAEPTPTILPDVGGTANAWGVRGLHGLVWEWIEDWNAALVSGDGRDSSRLAMCGAQAATARDARAYATFMRLAFRSALQARFTTANLGFRCAYDEEP